MDGLPELGEGMAHHEPCGTGPVTLMSPRSLSPREPGDTWHRAGGSVGLGQMLVSRRTAEEEPSHHAGAVHILFAVLVSQKREVTARDTVATSSAKNSPQHLSPQLCIAIQGPKMKPAAPQEVQMAWHCTPQATTMGTSQGADRVRGLGVSMHLWQHRELGEGPTDMPTPCSN